MKTYPANVLDGAIKTFLDRDPWSVPAPYVDRSFGDLMDGGNPDRGHARANPPHSDDLDPFHPCEQVWQGLEQEAAEEERETIHRAHYHHPELPEELPDLSDI